ncbi:MAG: radical SAM protein [Candidatus Fermentibacteraceae bacterium]
MNGFWFAFEVTPRCNLSCGYCYNAWRTPGNRVPGELALPEIRELFKSLRTDAPVSGVTLTGGEPLLRPDLSEIVAIAVEQGFTVAVATNGTLLTSSIARELRESGVRHFDIGIETPFAEVSGGIAGACATGASVTLSLCLTSKSFGSAPEVVRLAAALGADAVCLNRFVPTGRSTDADHLPSQTEINEVLRGAGRMGAELSLPVYAGIPLEPCVFTNVNEFGIINTACHCGEGKWAIGPDGWLRTCEQSPVLLGSLLLERFSTLRELPAVKGFREATPFRECRGCTALPSCGGGCRFLDGTERS